MEQRREPMDKNRIGGKRRWASGQTMAKPISIKSAGCKSGGCARKAVGLTSGDLPLVVENTTEGGCPTNLKPIFGP